MVLAGQLRRGSLFLETRTIRECNETLARMDVRNGIDFAVDRWGPGPHCTGMLYETVPHENGVCWNGDHLHPRVRIYSTLPLLQVVRTFV